MRFARSPAVQVACLLLLLGTYALADPKIEPPPKDEDESISDSASDIHHHRKQLEDEIDLDDVYDAEELKNEQLSFLPPIILLDFVNGTNSNSTNSTGQGDEKSKRTVDSNLGYGYNQNDLFAGNHNYYFPGDKTGATVSIEESVTPIPPQTVTELVKTDDKETGQTSPEGESLPDALPLQNPREPTPIYPPYPVFGQRTKLYKTQSSDFGQNRNQPSKPYHSSYSTFATPGSNVYNKLLETYTSRRPDSQSVASSNHGNSVNVKNYARPMPSVYFNKYTSEMYSDDRKVSHNLKVNTPLSDASNQDSSLSNYPKYTIENGIKYEHKIVWKYPDGRISEAPPASYSNSYSEYSEQPKVNPATSHSTVYQPRPVQTQQYQSPQGFNPNTYNANPQSNIYSQRPIQFPNDQDHTNVNQPKDQSKFVPSPQVVTPPPVRYETENLSPQQSYYAYRQNMKHNYRPQTNLQKQYSSYNHQPIPHYMINNANPEYSYRERDAFFLPNGQINKQILSKYSPEVQKYLMKVFASSKSPAITEYEAAKAGYEAAKTEYQPATTGTDYTNLLNYNPSISQYIKNPSSILNAHPTFVQAGNSLIPVIILRVDGAPPIQPKVESNINLKALLRQYLTQYASSVSKATQNTPYDFGGSSADGLATAASQSNPVEDLKHLTESLASLRQRGHQDPDFNQETQTPRNYASQQSQVSQQQASATGQEFGAKYNSYSKNYQKPDTESYTRRPKKVKNVQIIEDPRYTSHKVDNSS